MKTLVVGALRGPMKGIGPSPIHRRDAAGRAQGVSRFCVSMALACLCGLPADARAQEAVHLERPCGIDVLPEPMLSASGMEGGAAGDVAHVWRQNGAVPSAVVEFVPGDGGGGAMVEARRIDLLPGDWCEQEWPPGPSSAEGDDGVSGNRIEYCVDTCREGVVLVRERLFWNSAPAGVRARRVASDGSVSLWMAAGGLLVGPGSNDQPAQGPCQETVVYFQDGTSTTHRNCAIGEGRLRESLRCNECTEDSTDRQSAPQPPVQSGANLTPPVASVDVGRRCAAEFVWEHGRIVEQTVRRGRDVVSRWIFEYAP